MKQESFSLFLTKLILGVIIFVNIKVLTLWKNAKGFAKIKKELIEIYQNFAIIYYTTNYESVRIHE